MLKPEMIQVTLECPVVTQGHKMQPVTKTLLLVVLIENMVFIVQTEQKRELEELQKDGDLPLEELLKTLPPEVLDAPAPLPPPLTETEEEEDSDDKEDEEKVSSACCWMTLL